ncbi:CDI toxin immunity protein [Psychrobacter sp. HD31]
MQSKLSHVITVFDDITTVSFDTWIFIPETNNVIENTFGSLKITTN